MAEEIEPVPCDGWEWLDGEQVDCKNQASYVFRNHMRCIYAYCDDCKPVGSEWQGGLMFYHDEERDGLKK